MKQSKFVVILALAGGVGWQGTYLCGQTKVDLGRQSRNIDFSNASATKPAKLGVMLPATCEQGEIFFHAGASPGSNLHLCTATNTWTQQAGAITTENDGAVVGTRGAQNFVPGEGLITVLSDTGTKVNIQQTVDTAVIQSKASEQSGSTVLCVSQSGSPTTFTCSMTPTLRSYTQGMVVQWKPDVNGAGGATTLNIDTLGAKPIKLADGVTNPTAADLVAGRLVPLWYDGATFRIQVPGIMGGPIEARPTCEVTLRGRLWLVFGADGTKDEFAVCAKDAAGQYSWRTLY